MKKNHLEPPGRSDNMTRAGATRLSDTMKQKARMGRPPLPQNRRKLRVTVSVVPNSDPKWSEFARRCRVSKGRLVEWFLLSPEAEQARKEAVKYAYFFVPPA